MKEEEELTVISGQCISLITFFIISIGQGDPAIIPTQKINKNGLQTHAKKHFKIIEKQALCPYTIDSSLLLTCECIS